MTILRKTNSTNEYERLQDNGGEVREYIRKRGKNIDHWNRVERQIWTYNSSSNNNNL